MADIKGYDMPDELYYHEEHSWARVDGTKITVGMNDMFQKEAGDIVFVDLPEEEDEVEQGETCGKIQSRKWIGKLVALGIEKGRKVKPKLKVGICGEHGGDPKSIYFFYQAGMDYVSCSPYRVPIARFAAAQATILKKDKKKT